VLPNQPHATPHPNKGIDEYVSGRQRAASRNGELPDGSGKPDASIIYRRPRPTAQPCEYSFWCRTSPLQIRRPNPVQTMKWLSLTLALAGPSEAALRFGCSTVSIQRLDPLVEPGKLPSAHLHQIVGGNGFNATMEGDIAEKASCTTCTFSENFSNYWTAVMFFKHTNGSYKRVPIMQNTALPNGINGGMTIYYTQQDFNSNGNQKITAFKPVSTHTHQVYQREKS